MHEYYVTSSEIALLEKFNEFCRAYGVDPLELNARVVKPQYHSDSVALLVEPVGNGNAFRELFINNGEGKPFIDQSEVYNDNVFRFPGSKVALGDHEKGFTTYGDIAKALDEAINKAPKRDEAIDKAPKQNNEKNPWAREPMKPGARGRLVNGGQGRF